MYRSMALVVAGAVLSASFAFAGDKPSFLQLQPVPFEQRVAVYAAMRVRVENGRVIPLTPWMKAGDFAPAGPCNPDEVLVFDTYGADAAGNPVGGGSCRADFAPSTRYFFGVSYHNPYFANDIQSLVSPQFNGGLATSIAFAFFWNPNRSNPPSGAENCFVLIRTHEQFDADCQDAHEQQGNVLDAILLAIDGDPSLPGQQPLPAGQGYYSFAVCLPSLGLNGLRLPSTVADEGNPGTPVLGGYSVVFGSAFDPNTNTITLASGAQPMLWSTTLTGVGSSATNQFDDDNPTNGDHYPEAYTGTGSPGECFNYAFEGCPLVQGNEIYGGMMAFWVTPPSCTPSPDVDGNGCVDDADLLAVLFNFGNTGTGIDGDANCDGIVDDADLLEVLFAFGNGC